MKRSLFACGIVSLMLGMVLYKGAAGEYRTPATTATATRATLPATSQAVRPNELVIDNKRVTFSFEQDGKIVEPDDKGIVRLKPQAFSIRLTGDRQDVALLTVRDGKLLQAMKKHPVLVTSRGGYQACPDTELLITQKDLEICSADDTKAVQRYWMTDQGDAERFAEEMTKAMGKTPILFSSGRQCLKEDDAEAFQIGNLTVGNDEKAIEAGDALEVVVFLDSPLTDVCKKAVWKSIRLVFEK